MLYKKYGTTQLDEELFRHPTSEYRGTPFWAWNAALEKEELEEQIEVFQKMGFGGFHMHVRQGLEVPYLSNEFMEAVRFCAEKAKEKGMLAWLYDEDRWPSGCAGGFVTKEKKYRQKYLLMTKSDLQATDDVEAAQREGADYFLASFDISVDEAGEMVSYRRIARNEEGSNKWYYFVRIKPGGEPRYNYQSYVDTLSKDAIDRFIQITYEAFKEAVGEEFGKTVPAIFTDEPQLILPQMLQNGHSDKDALLPWTWDFSKTYRDTYDSDICDHLPELFFAMHGDEGKRTRYRYYRHTMERFAGAYMDNLGKWCGRNHIMFTGHVMGEDSLEEISARVGDAMRMYKEMQLPGIDMLFDDKSFTTAKQCQSVVRQYGREGMLSELYGVTGWDFDFRGHKFQGDWQACLGVTVRVPHLAWQTMKGEGKRDYPASIFYQSPWYQEYKLIEDHFARVSTAMTRGKSCVRTAVIHPIETYWLLRCSNAESIQARKELDSHFAELADWMLTGSVDFDYLAESLLEDLCAEAVDSGECACSLRVGEMAYDTIIVADCQTLRPFTIQVLKAFKENGGKLIFVGNRPYLSLGEPAAEAEALWQGAIHISHSKVQLYEALKDSRDVMIRNADGSMTDNLMYQLREEKDSKWLFVANARKAVLPHISNKQEICITVKGTYEPVIYDTLSGDIRKVSYVNENSYEDNKSCVNKQGVTKIYTVLYDNDSLLLKLENRVSESAYCPEQSAIYQKEVTVPGECSFTLEEPNVLVLDMAQYIVDNGTLQETEEIMRIDEKVRKQLGFTSRRTKVVQPWAIRGVPADHSLKLIFRILSRIDYREPMLAMENLEKSSVVWNGREVEAKCCGYYVDKYIHTMKLPPLQSGENILEITIPFGLRTDLENCYLLGNFGTAYAGRQAYITAIPDSLFFGSVVHQGLAFYGGNVQYHTQVCLDRQADVEFEISYYRGALVKVLVDGVERGNIIYAPFRLKVDRLESGIHDVTYVLYGNRYNTFSALHTLVADKKRVYIGPDYWRSEGDQWAYEYQTRPMGILKTPVVRIYID